MTLADLREGDSVFIDANIFIYHSGGRSVECKTLLERCARRELLGYTSASEGVRKNDGLLTNDSFVVAFMRERGLTKLATANSDFDRVGGIKVYKPTDL